MILELLVTGFVVILLVYLHLTIFPLYFFSGSRWAEKLSTPFLILGSNGKIKFINDAALGQWAFVRKDVVGHSLKEVFAFWPSLQNAVSTTTIPYSVLLKDPLRKKAYEVRVSDGPVGSRGRLVEFSDITHFLDQTREEYFEMLFASAPAALALLSLEEGKVLQVNALFRRIYDLTSELHIPSHLIFGGEANKADFLYQLKLRGSVRGKEWGVTTIEERRKWILGAGTLTQFHGQEVVLLSLVDITAQKDVEDLLKRNNGFLEALLSGTPNPVFYSNWQGTLVGYNKAFMDLMGGNPWQGESVKDFLPTGTRWDDMTGSGDEQYPTTMSDYAIEYCSNAGKTMNFLVSRGIVKGTDDRPEGLVFILKDITDLKNVENQLRERDRLFQGLSLASAALLKAEDNRLMIREALEHLGRAILVSRVLIFKNFVYREAQSIQTQLWSEWSSEPSGLLDDFQGRFFGLRSLGEDFHLKLQGGGPILIFAESVTDPVMAQIWRRWNLHSLLVLPLVMASEVWGFVGIVDPMKDREWTENESFILSSFSGTLASFIRQHEISQKVAEARANLSAVINNVSGLIWALDINLNYTVVNSAYRELILQNHGVLVKTGMNVVDLLSQEERDFWTPIYTQVLAGEKIALETRFGENTYEQIISPIIGETGGVTGIVAFSRDISARIEIEGELRRAKEEAEAANRAKSEFLANMSHEIRTPLNIVLGFADILSNQINDPVQRNYVESIKTSGKNLLLLINDILDLSKIEAGKMKLEYEFVDIGSITEEVVKIFSARAAQSIVKMSIFSNLNPRLLFSVDEIRFRQILFNLVGNAVKFTPVGKIEIVLDSEETEIESERMLKISVKDTGIGIKATAMENVFESFHQQDNRTTKKYGGTGLGLAITKRLVNMMGGQISVASEEGRGSVFQVIIPQISTRLSDPAEDKGLSRTKILFHNPSILLVEDNDVNRLVIKEILRSFQVTVLEAENGYEALEIMARARVDLVLMDIRMERMDGIETAKRIVANRDWERVPIIALTALAGNEDRERILSAPFQAYLTKPVDQPLFLDTLKKFLPYELVIQEESAAPAEKRPKGPAKNELERTIQLWSELEDRFLPQAAEALRSKNIARMEQFAKEFALWTKQHQLPFLEQWAEKLQNALKSFELISVEELLGEFPRLMTEIKEEKEGKGSV